jgi:CRP-like cAMP-binding protein
MQHFGKELIDCLGTLAQKGALSKQSAEFQVRMARAGFWVTFSKGQPVYLAGEPATSIFGLESGRLDVAIPIGADEEVVINRMKPGAWIGEAALMSDMKRLLSVWSATESRVFCVPADAIRRIVAEHPADMAFFLDATLRNSFLGARLAAELLSLPPQARFARLLLRLATPEGSVQATQEELGRMAGMSRAAFRRSCTDLIDAGAVQIVYGGVRITDRASLKRAAALDWETVFRRPVNSS